MNRTELTTTISHRETAQVQYLWNSQYEVRQWTNRSQFRTQMQTATTYMQEQSVWNTFNITITMPLTRMKQYHSEPQHFGSAFPQGIQPNVQPASFRILNRINFKNRSKNLDMLLDIPFQVTVELGRTKRSVKEILELSSGSIIELDKLAGEPVDIFVNNRLIAKGEVVVIDENFGVRVTDI